MRRTLALLLLAWPGLAGASPGYVPFVLGGGEVAIRDAAGNLRDWRGAAGKSHVLLMHDRTGQWYRVRTTGGADCSFAPGGVLVSGYGTDVSGRFGAGMWVRPSTYPYKRCLVRSARPVTTPPDQLGVDYAAEYTLPSTQAIARIVRCQQTMSSFWTRPVAARGTPDTLCAP